MDVQFGEIDENELKDADVILDPNIDEDSDGELTYTTSQKWGGGIVIGSAAICLMFSTIGSSFATIAFLSSAIGMGTFGLASIFSALGLLLILIAFKIFTGTFNPKEGFRTLTQGVML